MVLLRATWILFSAHLRRTACSRRALICLGLAALPVLAACLVVAIARRHGPAPALEIGWTLHVQFVVPMIALILGSAVVAEEVENRTISYLFTRPIPRPAVLLGRWLACLTVITVLLAASSAAVALILDRAAQGDPEESVPPAVAARLFQVTLIGGAVYSALFAAAGAWIKRSIIVGLVYTFAVEGFLANLPGANQKITVQYYLKSYLVSDDPYVLERWRHAQLITVDLALPDAALRTLAWILVASLAFGSWMIARKQYVLPS